MSDIVPSPSMGEGGGGGDSPAEAGATNLTDAGPISALSGVMSGAFIVMGGFAASKVLGLARNVVIGHQYGASREYELFLAAISVPDTVFQVLAGGAVASAFIPVFARHWARGQTSEAWRLTSGLANLAFLALGVIAVLVGLAAPLYVPLLAPGWPADEQARTASLVRIMLVCPALFAVSTLATSALNALDRFLLAAAAPLMYNLALCAGALFLRPLGAEGLALGAVAGALLHLLVQVPGLVRVGMRYGFTLGLDLAGTREVGRLMAPRMLGLGVSQLNQLVTIALASLLVQGSVAYLSYAWLVLMVPLGIVAMSISTATFPALAREAALGHLDQARETFQFGLRLICALSLAAAAALIVLARPAIGLLLERGAFGAEAAAATAFALTLYAIGLPGHATIEIASRAFYSVRDTATPVRVAAVAVGLNIGLSLILMRTGLSFGGLALANAVAALCEAAVLSALLQRRLGWIAPRVVLLFLGRAGLAAVALALAAALAEAAVGARVDPTQWTGQLALLAGGGLAGSLVYLLAARALGVAELGQAIGLLRRAR